MRLQPGDGAEDPRTGRRRAPSRRVGAGRGAQAKGRRRVCGSPAGATDPGGLGPTRLPAFLPGSRRIHLPPGSWRVEGAPEDPLARLAASDVVVAQGTTTLEAAALGRRVVVARSLGAHGASATVLTPGRYDEAARDPFGDPGVTEDTARLWNELLAADESNLTTLRQLVEKHNSVEVASQALGEALATTGPQ